MGEINLLLENDKKNLKIFFKNNFTYVFNISQLYPLQLPILHSHSPVDPFPTISSSGMEWWILSWSFI